ncbi:MAG: LysR substrate-binding domain-containing protein [Pseudomonadota bacterium]
MLRNLSSPKSVIVFDAAARLGSFTLAADELNMQQPSVSAAIKQLEQTIGVQLFLRGHRKVALTNAGERLFSGVNQGLNGIERAMDAVQEMRQSAHVTLNSSSAFSYYWMIPKLHLLRELHPEIDLRMQTSDREPNLDIENIDLGIRLGNGNWDDCHSKRIADEAIFPVASPLVMASAKNLRAIPNLLHERLIHLEEPIRERPTWEQWFNHHGIRDCKLQKGLRLNDYAMVLQAAVAGEGFAFGWRHIVQNLIDRNLLTGREEWTWKTGNGFFLVWSKTKPLSHQSTLVRDWIVSVSNFEEP